MLKKLTIEDFTVFGKAEFEFGMLNVIHGENATGKTHLLKLGYLLQRLGVQSHAYREVGAGEPPPARPWDEVWLLKAAELVRSAFGPRGNLGDLIRWDAQKAVVRGWSEAGSAVGFALSAPARLQPVPEQLAFAPDGSWFSPAVYLPASDVLSRDPSSEDLTARYHLREDTLGYEVLRLVKLPLLKELSPRIREIVEALSATVSGRPAVDDQGGVYFEHANGHRVGAPLAAQGHLKAAALALLLQRVELVGGSLFWDEPEANLNPVLLKHIAKALIDLAAAGVQVFIATHSLFLTRELDIFVANHPGKVNARFFGLSREGDGVAVHQGADLADAGDLAILDEELKQATEYVNLSWEGK